MFEAEATDTDDPFPGLDDDKDELDDDELDASKLVVDDVDWT